MVQSQESIAYYGDLRDIGGRIICRVRSRVGNIVPVIRLKTKENLVVISHWSPARSILDSPSLCISLYSLLNIILINAVPLAGIHCRSGKSKVQSTRWLASHSPLFLSSPFVASSSILWLRLQIWFSSLGVEQNYYSYQLSRPYWETLALLESLNCAHVCWLGPNFMNFFFHYRTKSFMYKYVLSSSKFIVSTDRQTGGRTARKV